MLQKSIEKLMKGQHLDSKTCEEALHAMLRPDANPAQSAAFLVLLRAKNETSEELTGFVNHLQRTMVTLHTSHRVLDIVGTGGDCRQSVNISTASAILAASCGVKIMKHGNRAVSSSAGSADVLEALGVVIDLTPEKISAMIDTIGIGFCFAPKFHPALLEIRKLRQQLRIPTTFNLLGPLLNPARPQHHLLGVFHEDLLLPMAQTLQHLGTERSWVVHGNGLDELSCIGPSKLIVVDKAGLKELDLDPVRLGLSPCSVADLKGGNAATNAQLLLSVFSNRTGKKQKAIADTLILNTAAALCIYGRHQDLSHAIEHARDNLLNGAALSLLNNWIECSHD